MAEYNYPSSLDLNLSSGSTVQGNNVPPMPPSEYYYLHQAAVGTYMQDNGDELKLRLLAGPAESHKNNPSKSSSSKSNSSKSSSSKSSSSKSNSSKSNSSKSNSSSSQTRSSPSKKDRHPE